MPAIAWFLNIKNNVLCQIWICSISFDYQDCIGLMSLEPSSTTVAFNLHVGRDVCQAKLAAGLKFDADK